MPIYLQERDRYLLELLSKDFLLLTREQIQELIPRGLRRTNQRLALLAKHGYLARRDPVDRLSPSTIFYYLGEKAFDALNVDDPQPIRDRRTRARTFGDSYLRHLHLINAVHIKFLVNKEADYEFRSWTPYDNTEWEDVPGLNLRPDGFVKFIKYGKPFCYFLEIDRGTERGESIRKKIRQYAQFDLADRFHAEFKHDWFRVLFITTEASRSLALLKLFPSKIFWTAPIATVLLRPLFEPCWNSIEGTSFALNRGPDPEQVARIEQRLQLAEAPPVVRRMLEAPVSMPPAPNPPKNFMKTIQSIISFSRNKKVKKITPIVSLSVAAFGFLFWIIPKTIQFAKNIANNMPNPQIIGLFIFGALGLLVYLVIKLSF